MGDLLAFNRRRLRRETGARVFLHPPSEVPELVTPRLPDQTLRVARRCWQRDGQIGFAFLPGTAA
jgi:hypothetical protein